LEFGEGDDLGFGEFFGTIGVNFVEGGGGRRLGERHSRVDANATKRKKE